jgi:hypothetical protein
MLTLHTRSSIICCFRADIEGLFSDRTLNGYKGSETPSNRSALGNNDSPPPGLDMERPFEAFYRKGEAAKTSLRESERDRNSWWCRHACGVHVRATSSYERVDRPAASGRPLSPSKNPARQSKTRMGSLSAQRSWCFLFLRFHALRAVKMYRST